MYSYVTCQDKRTEALRSHLSSKWSPLTNTTQLWIQDSIYMIVNQAQSLNKYPLLTLQLPTSSPINWHISLSFLKPDIGLLSWLFLQMSLLETGLGSFERLAFMSVLPFSSPVLVYITYT